MMMMMMITVYLAFHKRRLFYATVLVIKPNYKMSKTVEL